MKISWYPGHMHKARKELNKIMSSARVVIEVLDARAPAATTNPLLGDMVGETSILKILNKADLSDASTTMKWLNFYQSQRNCACLIAEQDKQRLGNAMLSAISSLADKADAETIHRDICIIFGIPNVGKSTLINALAGRKVAKTGNEPALTRGQQRIKLNRNWSLIDTPGMMWPNLEDQRGALCLALIGSIRQTALDIEATGWSCAELLYGIQPEALLERYRITESPESTESLMTAIASQVGACGKHGAVNWHKAAETLLNDYRSGKLGRISLESPPEWP